MQATILPITDYGGILYSHATASVLKPLDAIYHSALRFITDSGYRTHHCALYDILGWSSLELRRKRHIVVFIYKALLAKLPLYIIKLLYFNISVY